MNSKQMCRIALFSVCVMVGAFIKVPISIVPITLQTLFVTLAAYVLPNKESVIAIALYIVLGLCGLPVFANGGGIAYVLQPSFGYLLGFIVAAYVISIGKQYVQKPWQRLALAFIALALIYIIGMTYFYVIQRFVYGKVFTMGWLFYFLFLVYLPGDILSAIVAFVIANHVKKAIKI